MMRSLILTTLATSAISLPAIAETRNFDLEPFEAIKISAGVNLVATAGHDQSIEVETKGGDFSDFDIEVEDGVLYLSREWNRLSWSRKKADYKVTITVPRLDSFAASSGAHSMLNDIDARQFNADLSSGSFTMIAGRSDDCVLYLSSGASLDARAFICSKANVGVSSGGYGKITVIKALMGNASSGGHMTVFGSPEQVNIDRSSGGRIKLKASLTATRN